LAAAVLRANGRVRLVPFGPFILRIERMNWRNRGERCDEEERFGSHGAE